MEWIGQNRALRPQACGEPTTYGWMIVPGDNAPRRIDQVDESGIVFGDLFKGMPLKGYGHHAPRVNGLLGQFSRCQLYLLLKDSVCRAIELELRPLDRDQCCLARDDRF